MSLERQKIEVEKLALGMYVSELDRPWLGTPFLLQGFNISSDEELLQLRSLCRYVYIDVTRSGGGAFGLVASARARPKKTGKESLTEGRRLMEYEDSTSLHEELPAARRALRTLSDSISAVLQRSTTAAAIDVASIERSVAPMVDSICRNPDAAIWLARLRRQDQYTYQHSVACSVWAVALGRQLGFPKPDLKALGLGGVLFDIGKLDIDRGLLAAPTALSPVQLQAVREHVALGEAALKHEEVSPEVIEMLRYHHERHDGSGYPYQLVGEQIPVFARIAGIVDAFDAMTSHRPYAPAISPSAAIRRLNESRDREFQAEVVDEFIQAIGIYPAGTLVELTSGEVAVVVAEGRQRRLRPTVMLLLDPAKQPLLPPRVLDLKQVTTDVSGAPLDIITSLEADAYGIDLSGLDL